MFGLFVALVVAMNYALVRTQWGRAMSAVGGNREAARRAGINVRRIYTRRPSCSARRSPRPAACSRRRGCVQSSQQAGTGDVNLNAIAAAVIGGTSLFGGRGSAYSALLGIIVIQSIASGADAARSVLVAPLHDHRRRAGRRRHRRLARPPLARVPWPQALNPVTTATKQERRMSSQTLRTSGGGHRRGLRHRRSNAPAPCCAAGRARRADRPRRRPR